MKKKQLSPRSSIISDMKYLGKEPDVVSEELTTLQLIKNYNWYNSLKDKDDAKKYILEYAQTHGIKVDVSKHYNNTYGWLCRMLLRGFKVSNETMDKLNVYLKSISKSKEIKVETEDNNKTVKYEKSDFTLAGQWLADIDDAIDNYKVPFNAYNYFNANVIPQKYVKFIEEYYNKQKEEIENAYSKTDKDLVESYRVYKRNDLKSLKDFFTVLLGDCSKYLNNVKKERKPKKKREKSISSILKNFKYQKEDNGLKLVSVNPETILESTSLYVLNTKTKTLYMFIAKEGMKLGINRTAIINYDETKSRARRIGRHMDKVLDEMRTSTKRSRPKIFEAIKASDTIFTNRLNENSIIMYADK